MKSRSFFVLGPRGTGKSTWIKHHFQDKNHLYVDLLDPMVEDLYRVDPQELRRQINASSNLEWVIIDEVQKLPKLLDLVHQTMEETKIKFVLSGSSARKLKRGSANLLAGRASMYHLWPFTSAELGDRFDLDFSLRWGALPQIYSESSDEGRREYLRAYAVNYLKEEIQAEQIVRKLDPFRTFLQVAAQTHTQIVNFAKISRDVGVDVTTVQNYFSILEDTLIGILLPAYHTSIRKRQLQSPKFYFFDPGVVRSLTRQLNQDLTPGSFAYGLHFEQFLILEIMRLAEYKRLDYEYSYLRTKDGVEIDLIIDRPGSDKICMEIKSSDRIQPDDVHPLLSLSKDIPHSKAYCLSRDLNTKKIGHVTCLHWKEGLRMLDLVP